MGIFGNLFGERTTIHETVYTSRPMTQEERARYAKAWAKLDDAFKAMNEAFEELHRG